MIIRRKWFKMAIVLITAIVVVIMYVLYIAAYVSEKLNEEEIVYEK